MPASQVVFLEGHKTVLRPFNKKTDLANTTRGINNPKVNRFLKFHLPCTEMQEAEWFDKLGKDDKNIVLAITVKTTGLLIGSMGLHRIGWKDRVATTGAVIWDTRYWGKGYGTDAKMALLEYAFHRLNLHKVCSSVIAFNDRSLQYSLHCGYQIEGRRKEHIFTEGRYWDMVELGLFRNQWEPIYKRWKKNGNVR